MTAEVTAWMILGWGTAFFLFGIIIGFVTGATMTRPSKGGRY